MFTKIASGQEICPFTLELREKCRERKIVNHKKICSFTLEPCLFISLATFAMPKVKASTWKYYYGKVAPVYRLGEG